MKFLIFLSILLLTGCFQTPPTIIKQKFPNADKELLQPCPELKLVDTNTSKLTDLLDVVIDNYNEYHNCRAKVDDWIFWYTEQKKIFEKVK